MLHETDIAFVVYLPQNGPGIVFNRQIGVSQSALAGLVVCSRNIQMQSIPGVVATETMISLEQSIKREIPVIYEEGKKK